jgi:hypothetical protein
MAENPFITSGAPARKTFTSAESSVIISSQCFAAIALSPLRMLAAAESVIDRLRPVRIDLAHGLRKSAACSHFGAG